MARAGIPAQQLKVFDRDRPAGQQQLLAPPGPGVGPLAINMHRTHRWRALLDQAAEGLQLPIQFRLAQARPGLLLEHLPTEVITAGAQTQLDGADVVLFALEVGQ